MLLNLILRIAMLLICLWLWDFTDHRIFLFLAGVTLGSVIAWLYLFWKEREGSPT